MKRRALAFGPALVVLIHGLLIGPRFDRFVLPAFDGYVYAGMAESPTIFTLAPWGYRILMPFLVHVFPWSSAAVGYYWINLALLAAVVWAASRWLKDLGFTDVAAASGGFALALSPPFTAILEYQILVDPLALLIFTFILAELAAPRLSVLAGLFALGAITKEICLIPLVPLVLLRVWRVGWRRGVMDSVTAGLPALALAAALRATWGHDAHRDGLPLLALVRDGLPGGWGNAAGSVAASGLTVVALVGFFRTPSVELRVIGSLIWALTFIAALINPYEFSVADLPRLSAFAWPGLLPLALCGLGFRRTPGPPLNRTATEGLWFGAAAILLAGGIVVSVDAYRRAPLDPSPNPVTFLARNRESIKMAQSLDQGETFVFDARVGRFAAPIAQTFNLAEGRRQRFFLQAGFGKDAALAQGTPEFQSNAELLLPLLTPRDTTLTLELEADRNIEVEVSINNHPIGIAGTAGPMAPLRFPKSFLFRGENLIGLTSRPGGAVRLPRFEIRLLAAADR